MNFIKLQLGCLLISVYILILYIKETLKDCTKCNPIYDILIAIAPWAIFFDGATAWTVNHLDIVPPIVNLILHCLFFVLMDLEIFISFLYILQQTKGISENKLFRTVISIPFAVSIILILVFLKDLYYVHGKITNYSMGKSVIACYSSCALYFGSIFVITLARLKYIEVKKRIGILTAFIATFAVLIIQILFPEVLITSLVSIILLLGFYVNIEDPSYVRLKEHNNVMVTGFATLVENRDNSTGGHIVRTKEYVSLMLQKMKNEKKYSDVITKDFELNMKNAAPMHDIGKISTPDYILQKPGKLTTEEFEIIKRHAPDGGEIIIDTFGEINSPDFLKIAYEVARFHHEKWNGKGYPEGLKGKEIPLSARIMAVADVFDAVSAKRCYRDALPLETCFKIIEEGSGTDFDPDLVRIFMESKSEITELYNKFIN